ncbi:unnamed protein product, partial [Medioppia subpectinata]
MNALFRLNHITKGKILIDGADITKIPTHLLRSRLSVIPQDVVLFSGTIRDNMDPNHSISDDKIWSVLNELNLKHSIGSLEEMITEEGLNLSAGQRQMLCIGRALLRDSQILIMDESTSALDEESEQLILDLIHKSNKTVISIAHKLSNILNYDKIVVVDNGLIAESELDIKWQQKYGKIYGVYEGTAPILMVSDPELIKHILVKDFDIFADRYPNSKSNKHPIIGKMLTELRGDDWKRVRSITSPVFTSLKLKAMYPTVRQSVEGFVNTLDTYAKDEGMINAKDMFGCYTMDVISNCAFGIKSDAYKDPNNPFVVNGKVVIEVPVWKVLLPEFVLNMLNIKTFFSENVRKGKDGHEANCIDGGEEESGIEKKILDIKAPNKFLTEDEMIAQGFIFFAAGNVTANNTMAFCSYELALNPEVQQKL